MPASSKKQFRFMAAAAAGKVKSKGLSRKEARKFIHDSKGTYKDLPEAAAIKSRMKKGK